MPEPSWGEGLRPLPTIIAPGKVIAFPCRRIQRPRRRGATLPPNAIYVGRPTIWGNPFADRQWGHAKSVILHRRWLTGALGALTLERLSFSAGEIDALERWRTRVFARLHELSGRDLACWCPISSRWCHADVYRDLLAHPCAYERIAA